MILSEKLSAILWKLFLLFLPISSAPFLSNLFGGTSVAPLAFIPMALLVIFAWLPAFFKNGMKLPYQVKPLIVFFFFGLLSTCLAVFHEVPTFRDIPWWKNVFEVIVTFGMGLGFYIITLFIVDSEDKLKMTIKWLSYGGMVLIFYSWLQYAVWLTNDGYPSWLRNIHVYITSNGMLYPQRATGLAYEPSWLAHESNFVYIPILFGLSISGHSVFKKKRFGKIQYEIILLILAIGTLFISYSRVGWIILIITMAYVAFRFVNRWSSKMTSTEKNNSSKLGSKKGNVLRTATWLGFILGFLGILVLAGYIMTKVEPRMAGLFDFERLLDFGFLGWASKLSFAERIIFWLAAYNVFQMFPVFGAGFGLPGYYFTQTAPDFGTRLHEINMAVLAQSFIPNAKNLWMRLLAETGIIGFSIFVSWVFLHWRNANQLEKKANSPLLKAMGLIGKLVVLAFIIEGFSLDSFALPYYWVAMGLVAASSLIADQASVKMGANIESTKESNSSENSFSTGKSSLS